MLCALFVLVVKFCLCIIVACCSKFLVPSSCALMPTQELNFSKRSSNCIKNAIENHDSDAAPSALRRRLWWQEDDGDGGLQRGKWRTMEEENGLKWVWARLSDSR